MSTTHDRLTSADRLLACAVCERTILLGEEPLRFTYQSRSRTVCRLCASEARADGWVEDGRPAPPPVTTQRFDPPLRVLIIIPGPAAMVSRRPRMH